MKVWIFCFIVLYSVAGVGMASRIEFGVEKHQLKNGLTVLLHHDASTPLVTLHQWFRVGSSYERPGIRGLAHFFEHLMFKGTKRFSKNAFDLLVQSYGGENNAFTSLDYTGYYVSMPAGNLEQLLDVEADRMQNLQLTPDNIRTEREVVKEERRYSIDNSISGQINETLFELLFRGSSYGWPIIGYMKDLNAATKLQLNTFYKTYYAPNNAVLVLAGQFNKKQVLRWVNKYYASIPRQRIKAFRWTRPVAQKRMRQKTLRKNIQNARGVVAFVAPPAGSKDAYALDLLASILAGDKSSRLYQSLVYKGQRVTSVSAYNYSPQRAGVFSVEWSMKPGLGLDDSLKSIRGELYRARKQLVTAEELERAKNTVLFEYVSSLQSLGGKAYALALNEVVMGDYKYLFSDLDRYARVTARDIRVAAQKYLTPARRNELRIVPQ